MTFWVKEALEPQRPQRGCMGKGDMSDEGTTHTLMAGLSELSELSVCIHISCLLADLPPPLLSSQLVFLVQKSDHASPLFPILWHEAGHRAVLRKYMSGLIPSITWFQEHHGWLDPYMELSVQLTKFP